MKTTKDNLLTEEIAKSLQLSDVLALDKLPVPKGNTKKIDHPGFIYFLFFKDILVYVGKTNMKPEERVVQHKRDKFFDSYSYMEVMAGEDIDSLEKAAISSLNPIYNSDGASGEVDTLLFQEHGIIVAQRGCRDQLGGNVCVIVCDDESIIIPSGKVVGWDMRGYGRKIYFDKNVLKVLSKFKKEMEEVEIDIPIYSECESFAEYVCNFYYEDDGESETVELNIAHLEIWTEHLMYYCYKNGVGSNNIMYCLTRFLKHIFKDNLYKIKISEKHTLLNEVIASKATHFEVPPRYIYKGNKKIMIEPAKLIQ